MNGNKQITPTTLYQKLHHHYGHLPWWPVDTTYHAKHQTNPNFEILIGCILTQNTTWKNVEKALNQLKKTNNLSINKFHKLSENQLAQFIKSSGYYNQKAHRLKLLTTFIIAEKQGDISKLFSGNPFRRRIELLSLKGIGPETADSMLLYAGHLPFFVIDTYTKRLSKRIPLIENTEEYTELQQFFQNDLQNHFPEEKQIQIFQQLHALIVEHAKTFCRPRPLCNTCPIQTICSKKF